MTRFGHKLNYVINTFVKHTPATLTFEHTVPRYARPITTIPKCNQISDLCVYSYSVTGQVQMTFHI